MALSEPPGRRLKVTRLLGGAIFALALVAAFWLFHGDASPIYPFAAWHADDGNVLGLLSLFV
jgi:hypothetical protein